MIARRPREPKKRTGLAGEPAFRLSRSRSPRKKRFGRGVGTAEGRTPGPGDAALDCPAQPAAYLRIRLRSTYCMMPPLR